MRYIAKSYNFTRQPFQLKSDNPMKKHKSLSENVYKEVLAAEKRIRPHIRKTEKNWMHTHRR